MASRRSRDRWTGAVLGALVVLVLLALLALGTFVLLSEPAGRTAAPPVPAAPRAAAGVPSPPARLAAGQTWLGDVTLGTGTLLTPDADLRDVSARGTDVLTGTDGIRAGTLDVAATVPFAVVAAQIGPGTTVTPARDGQASVHRTVEVLGRRLDVVATGTVDAVGGRLVVEPRSIDIGGPTFLAEALGAAARDLVTIEQEVQGLPRGLVLREVTVTDDGFRARLDGTDVLVAP